MMDDPRNWNNTKKDNIKGETNKILFFHIHLPETINLSCLYSSLPSQISPGILYKFASLLSNWDTAFFLPFFVSPSFLLKATKRYFNSFSLPSLCSSLYPTCCLSGYPPRSTQPYKDKVIEQITKLLETENDFLKIIWKITFKPKYYIFRGKTPEDTDKYKGFHKQQSIYIKITSIDILLGISSNCISIHVHIYAYIKYVPYLHIHIYGLTTYNSIFIKQRQCTTFNVHIKYFNNQWNRICCFFNLLYRTYKTHHEHRSIPINIHLSHLC